MHDKSQQSHPGPFGTKKLENLYSIKVWNGCLQIVRYKARQTLLE